MALQEPVHACQGGSVTNHSTSQQATYVSDLTMECLTWWERAQNPSGRHNKS